MRKCLVCIIFAVDIRTKTKKYECIRVKKCEMLLNSSTDDEVSEKERDALFLASVSGKWEDSRSADEMVKDIYASRTERDDAELVSAFSE